MKSKMTLEKLAEIIEKSVAKKEDIEALRVDLKRLEVDMGDIKVKQDRLQTSIDQVKELAEETEKSDLNLKLRVQKLEKRVFTSH